jgi:predicted Zn-dependent peptidase
VHDPLYYAYEVAVGAVGQGMSSPLFDEIREKRGLVYSVGASADIHESSGTISVTAGTTADKLDELFTAVTQVFQSSSEKIRPIDMERAKNSICVSLATGHERPFNRLLNSVQSIFTYGEIRSIESDIEKIRAVTPAQVKKVIAKILDAKKSVVVVGNKVDLDVVERFAE